MVTPSEMRLVKQNPNQQVVDWWIALLTHMEMGTFRQIQVVGIRCKKNFQTAIFFASLRKLSPICMLLDLYGSLATGEVFLLCCGFRVKRLQNCMQATSSQNVIDKLQAQVAF